jgi:type IV pilus assembly protein PilW
LLARNNDITAGYQDTKTYNLGGAGTVGPLNDSYKRHAYNELVRVINPSGRRE